MKNISNNKYIPYIKNDFFLQESILYIRSISKKRFGSGHCFLSL